MSTTPSFDRSQLLKGALDLAVLAVIGRTESYGYEVFRLLRASGLEVSEASIYGTLSRLFRGGLLTARIEASTGGPHRKYYALSADGVTYLHSGRQQWMATATAIDTLLTLSTERSQL